MGGWFDDLTGDLQVFYVIGIVAGVFLMFQLILLAFGFGFDADVDFDGGDGGFDVGFLSLRTLTAFFFAFGWTGVIMKEADQSTPAAVGVAVAVGLAMFLGVGLLWRQFTKLQETGSVDYANAVGVTGSVYLPIAANRTHPGKVEVMVQGRLAVVDAYTRQDEDIPSKTRVRVVEVIDSSTVLVERI